MKKYGVKLNNGKIMWVQAESAEVSEGALLFFRGSGGQRELIAGFSLLQVNHWGVPDAFASEKAGEKPGESEKAGEKPGESAAPQ